MILRTCAPRRSGAIGMCPGSSGPDAGPRAIAWVGWRGSFPGDLGQPSLLVPRMVAISLSKASAPLLTHISLTGSGT